MSGLATSDTSRGLQAQGLHLTYAIVNSLGKVVVGNRHNGDNQLPTEAELATAFGASRSAVREAVKILATKGLVGARPKLGIFVQSEHNWNYFDPDVLRWLLEGRCSRGLLKELVQVQLLVEPGAAALAASQSSTRARSALRAALSDIKAAANGDADPLASEVAFRKGILRASGNRFFASLEHLAETAVQLAYRGLGKPDGRRIVIYVRIYEAISGGEPAKAEAAMRRLIERQLRTGGD